MIKPVLTCKKLFLAVVLSFSVLPLLAGRYAVATGNWSSTSTWSTTHGGASGASVPTSSDTVYIDNGYTVTVDVASVCQSLQLGGTTSGYGNGVLAFGGSFALTISGAVTIGNSAAGTTGSITMASGTLACTGITVNNGGTWTYGTGTVQLTADNTLPTSWITTFYNLAVSGGTTTTNNGNITVNNTLSGTGGLTQGTNATLNLGGTSGITTLTATASGNTVNYTGATQTVHSNNYYNLTLSGSGTATLQTGTTAVGGNLTLSGTVSATTVAALTITGNLIIGNSTTFTAAAYALTVSGTITVGGGTSGTLAISSATGTKTFTGAVTINSGASMTENAAATLVFGSDVTISGTLTESGAATVGIAGNLTDNGTYTASTGVHTFSGASKTLSGTSSISIPSATFTGAYTNSGTLVVSTALTVTGVTLTNNGTITASSALSGTGGLTQGTNATLNLGGTSGITTLTATASGNTVNYTGAAQTVHSNNYYSLTLSGSGAKTLQAGTTAVGGNLTLSGTVSATTVAALTITGNLIIGNSTTFTAAAYALTVSGTTTVGGGTSGTLIISSSTGAKLFTGLVTIGSGATWNNSGNSAVELRGGITSSGTFTAGSGVYTFDTNNQAITGTLSIPGITVTAITLTNNNTLTVSTALSGTGGLTQSSNATLNIGGTSAITTFTATNSGNTVNYTGTAQTINSTNYYNLTLSGSGIKTFSGVTVIGGTLTINGSAQAALSAGTNNTAAYLLLGGINEPSGTYGSSSSSAGNKNDTYFTSSTGIVTVGTGCTGGTWLGTTSTDWNTGSNWCGGVPTSSTNVIIPSGTTYAPTIGSTGGICNSITINNSATLTIGGAYSLTVSGNWTNNGAFAPGTGTVTFNGTTVIAGSTSTSFYNTTLSGSASVSTGVATTVNNNLTIGDGTTFTAAGFTLTVTGATTIGGGTSGALIISSSAGAKLFTGLVTIASGGTWNNSGNSAIELRGGITNNGTFTAGSGVYTFDTNNQAITGILSIPSVAVTAITLTNNNTLTVSTALSGTGGLTQSANATLNIGGTSGITTLAATNSGNTVNYSGTGQTLKVTSYYNLTLSGGAETFGAITTITGNLTLSGSATATTGINLSIGGNLLVGDGTTFTVGAYTLGVTGTTTVGGGTSGTLSVTSTTGTKTFTGALTINNGGAITETAAAALSFGSDVTITGTLTENGDASVGIAGSLTNNGTYTSSTGTHTFSGSSKTIGGTNSVFIPSATFAGTYTNSGTLTVSTALSGTGGLTQGTSAVLNIGGTSGITSLTASATGNIVIYSGTNQSVNGTSFYNLTISGSGTKTMSGDVLISQTLTLTAGTFTVGSNTLTLNGPTIAGTPSNLSTSASSSLVFGGSSSGLTIPSSVANLNNLTINNANGVTMNGNITLASGGTLALSSGILGAGTYLLSITNTAAAAISYTSGSFVNVTTGGLQRSLPSNLSGTGNNYLFPIGESNVYKAINLADINTGTTGPVLKSSVSSTGALTGDNITINSVFPRYWSLINTNGGNFTSARVELYESGLDATKTIGMSSAVSGNYSSIGGTLKTSSIISPSVLSPGPYFCIGLTLNTYYSYQTGDWNTPSTWTSDPSGTLQIGSTVPGNNNTVVILPGRTVTISSNITTQNLNLTINDGGFLDLTNYMFTNGLSVFQGQGTLRLSSVNFPSATTNTFINSGGGTTEYYNSASFTLPSTQLIYNNLTINCSAYTATQLSNITLNGNLLVKSGTFRINDNSSTTALTLTVNGNITVNSGASIAVGNGVTNTTIGGTGGTAPFLNYYLNFHTVIVKGDFTNNGTVKFNNLPYPLYTSFPPTTSGATSGAASVYFQGASNNTLACNGITCFYNLIINKGTDQTYSLTINSTAYANFSLFGANSLTVDGSLSGNPGLRKALWICTGTLDLKGSLIIPSLTEGTAANADYYIPSSGAMIIDGVDVVVLSTADDYREVNLAYSVTAPDNTTIGVTTGGYSAMDIYGRLQINNGYLSTRESGGLITSSMASGQLIINDGTVDAKQFLSSTGAAAYMQTGGTFILRGRFQRTPTAYSTVSNLTDVSTGTLNTSRATSGTTSGYGSFNLENASNIYTVSGGAITIYDVCGTGSAEQKAFDVKSSSSNINVTGGSLNIVPLTGTTLADAANYYLTTNAPVANLTINRLSSSSIVGMSTALTVQNNFTLTAGAIASNNYNLTIGGNFYLETGTTYTPGTNTTILNGTSNQVFTINQASALSLYGFTITKSSDVSVTLAGSQSALNVTGAFNLTLGTLNDAGKTINISGTTIYNSGIHSGTGVIVLNGTSAQTIDGNGIFQNITLNNTTSATAPVSLLANTTINGNLTFSQDKLFNIGTYNLTLNSSASIVNGSSARYVQTAGNSGDGGMTKVYASQTAFVFHVGAPTINPARAVKYTPASIGFSTVPTTYGSVTVVPVGYEHPSTTTKGQSLTYFWRVKSSGFSGIAANSVTHTFTYDQSDVVGTESNYVPALYTRNDYTWRAGTNSNPPIDISVNLITDWTTPTNSTNYLDADYTAGISAFGTPVTFYSIASSDWSLNTTWSYTSGGPAVPAGTTAGINYPGPNSIVIIENNNTVNLTADQSCASLQIQSGSTLDIYTWTGSVFSMVLSYPSGNNGLFRLTTTVGSPKVFSFPANSDFSDFNNNHGTTEFYDIDGATGAEYILPANVNSYGNLLLRAKGGDNLILPNNSFTTINGDLTVTGDNPDAWVTMSWLTGGVYSPVVEKTVNITGNFFINNGTFLFLDDQTPQHLIVDGNVTIASGAVFDTYNGYPVDNGTNPRLNSFVIGGSFINNSNSNPSARFINGNNYVNLTLSGSTNASITSTGGAVPVTIFNNVTVSKGTSQATTLTCNIAGTLTTPADNWLTLMNGTLIYNRTGNFTISQGTDFTIPATSGLTINTPSNVYIANNASNNKSLFLNGRLTILNGGGNVYVGPTGNTVNNADIEYSGSGASAIEIQGGNLIVTGQIRRPVSSTNDILSYTQSDGNVIIYGNNSNVANAKLEVLNNGSTFTMSGGTLTIVNGGGTTFGDLYLRPSSGSVTGGTVSFTQTPPDGTVFDAVQTYQLEANLPLNNLTVTGKTAATARNATLTLMISPLVLNGSLTLSNIYSIFNSNNLNISIAGNMNNSGTYNYGTNTTTFNGSIESITGSSLTNYFNLAVSSSTSLTVNSNFTVNGNLAINTGNLILSSSRLSLLGNLTNNGSYSDNNTTGGISLSGTVQQMISGTGQFGLLELNNSAGAKLTNDINMQDNLVMTQGILDINIFALTLNQNSLISGSSFGVTKMIKSDGVVNCPGVKKFFPASSLAFTFPVGVTGKYTPVTYTITANATVGYIRVNPINNYNPGVTDPSNALDYYWQVESSGISGFSATTLFQYMSGDVFGVESNYVASWLELPANLWHLAPAGPSTDNVNEATHQITFISASVSSLTGDYTAGITSAFPAQVPTYQSDKDGNWSDVTVWTPVGSSPPCPAGGPERANVIINNVITTDVNNIFVYSTTINNRLNVVSPTYGHNLGTVTGNGTLYVENGNIPGGIYTSFISCSGNGTIEYGGTGSYTIIATLFSSLPNISFTGTGTRILPDKDLTICNNLLINGPTLDNSVNNRRIVIQGTMERYGTGAFLSGTGTYPLATVTFAGTSAQTLGGPTGDFSGSNMFYNLEINNPAGLTIGTGGSIDIGNQLLLTNGIISTVSSNRLAVLNTSTTAVTPAGGSSSSYISGPFTKYIVNGDAFIFPVGKGSVMGHPFTLTSTAGTTTSFTVEYFTPNTMATSVAAPIVVTNTGEYWGVSTLSPATARITIAWDPQSELTPLSTTNGISDMRVAEFDSGYWTQLTSTATGDSYYGTVSTVNSVTLSTTVKDYTTASITGTLARASFATTGPICGTTSGILLSFTSFQPINLNYTIGYSLNGVSQTPITVTALPYTMPTPSSGSYKLTSFKYNNGTGTGVVDATTITVYDNPTTANAGTDQSLCGISSATLAGNNPSPYSGLWTITSGSGGSFVSSAQYNTVFTGILGNAYILQWTISNGPCSSSDNVIISFPVVASTPGDFTSDPTIVCRGTTGNVYTVPYIAGVTYNWSYSGTGQTINGTGNSVTVDFNSTATSGTLGVTATNNCGTSPARTVTITVPVADFSYTGSPFCQNNANPAPVLAIDGVAGTFTSTDGLVFINTSTGQINLAASTPGNYTVTNTAVVSCGTITSTSPVTISGLTWTGAISTDWNVAGNWSCGFVPYPTTHAEIPGVANHPVLSSGSTGTVNNLTIDAGTSLTITGNELQIAGNITNNGSFTATNGTITLNGSSAQSVGANIFTGNTINNLHINNSAGITLLGSLNVTGSLLVQNGTLASGGFLTLVSAAGQTALIDGSGNGTVSGTVTMQRYLPSGFGYKYISSPFQASTVSELADDIDLSASFPNLYKYDESQTTSGWVSYVTPTNTLYPMQGYAANFGSSSNAFTADISGIVNNGALSLTLYNHNNTYTLGFNLVGNPYPSPINWDAASGWTKTNIDNALYYFKASTTDQYDGTYSTYVNGISSDGLATGIIPSMQGFFVHVTNGTYPVTGTLGLNNNVRVTDQTHPFMKSSVISSGSLVRLTAAFADDTTSDDPLVIYFNDKASPGFDSDLDALKLMNTDYNVPNFFAAGSDGAKLSINALPIFTDTLCTVPLGLSLQKDGNVKFRIRDIDSDLSDIGVQLTDIVTGIRQDLLNGKEYSVSLTSGDYNSRFYLNLTSVSTGIPEVPANKEIFSVYSSHGFIKATFNIDPGENGILTICNITGQILDVRKILAPGYYEFDPGLSEGIYIVTFTSGNFKSSKKLFIQNR